MRSGPRWFAVVVHLQRHGTGQPQRLPLHRLGLLVVFAGADRQPVRDGR
jgi:hypothetical protein